MQFSDEDKMSIATEIINISYGTGLTQWYIVTPIVLYVHVHVVYYRDSREWSQYQ